MRKILDLVYFGAAVLAGICLVGIAVLVLVQIGGRLIGVFVRGADQIVGYLLAASTFLALAHTFATGGHIRVGLLLEAVPPRLRNLLEHVCLVLGAALSGYIAWHAIAMTWQSYQFMDVASGLIAMPLWIPQVPLAVGALVLFVAVIDMFVTLIRGGKPSHLGGGSEGARS